MTIITTPGFLMLASLRSVVFVAPLVLALILPGHAEAQLGGLLKKKIEQATAGPQVGQPVKFDNVVLEITADRITKLIAAKRASKQIVNGPNGPGAYEARADSLDARQAAIYEKQAEHINTWDAKRREYENCLDSAFSELKDKAQARTTPQSLNDPQMQKFMQLGQQMALAQQRGDTAAVRKIVEQLEKMKEPSKADSLSAQKACGPPPAQSAPIKQWYELKAQLDTLGKLKAAAEDTVRATEWRISGMHPQQSAMFCERIKAYIAQLKNKKKEYVFTDAELKTMVDQGQVLKDLEALCP